MQPDIALNSWRQWTGQLQTRPVILNSLSGGRSNRSFLLESDGQKMVLRLNGTDSVLPNANRRKEIDIWQAASTEGITPSLLHVDERNGFLVSAYINNDLPCQPQYSEIIIDQAFKLLDRCHQLDVEAPTIDYSTHIEKYWQFIEGKDQISNPNLGKQREPMRSMLLSLINSNTPKGLCHHDPVVANFVGSPARLYLIDWEYAAMGLQIMDYAAMATEWQIDDASILTRTRFKPESLIMAKILYEYLCSLWQEATT